VSRELHTSKLGHNLAATYAAYVRLLQQQEDEHQSVDLVGFEYQAKARARQLDTLLHLSRFSDYLVLVSAPPGAGKSTFIEQFFRAQPAEAYIVHLALTETVSAAWVVLQIAQQLPLQLPNNASLEAIILAVQELAQELRLQEQVLLLVVDDAQWLDDEALELLANLLPRSAKVDSRPHVILSADPSLVERIEAPQFTEMRKERFYHLVLAPFSQEESADYLRQRLQRIGIAQGQGLAPIQLLQLHQLAKGNPGYLNMLANKALSKGGFVQQTGLPLLHIGATLLVVLLLAGVWLFNNLDAKPSASLLVSAAEPAVVVADDFEAVAKALPPLEHIELSPAADNISLQPVVILELQTQSQIEPQPAPVRMAPVEPAAAEPISAKAKPAWPMTTVIKQQPYAYQAIMNVPAGHYSLQVLGARLEPTLEAFLVEHKLGQPYFALQLERGDEPWFLLLIGDYANASEARNAIKSLPLALRNQQPWPRAVLKIQQQIRNKFNTSGE